MLRHKHTSLSWVLTTHCRVRSRVLAPPTGQERNSLPGWGVGGGWCWETLWLFRALCSPLPSHVPLCEAGADGVPSRLLCEAATDGVPAPPSPPTPPHLLSQPPCCLQLPCDPVHRGALLRGAAALHGQSVQGGVWRLAADKAHGGQCRPAALAHAAAGEDHHQGGWPQAAVIHLGATGSRAQAPGPTAQVHTTLLTNP